jgi:DNA polymerase III alpha subunit
MLIDSQGFAFVSEDDLVELLLEQKMVKILPSNLEKWDQFDQSCKVNHVPNLFTLAEADLAWNIPENYKNIDIEEYLLKQCKHPTQFERVEDELALFKERNLYDLLRFLMYFMDVVKTHNVIYGVGRGSSVASYCLYLLGVHRVNSLKYNLDIKEFLK